MQEFNPWTTERTQVLSIKGVPAIEVKGTELGLLVTAAFHVKVPPWHNGVFEVKIHGETEGTYIVTPTGGEKPQHIPT